MGVSFAQREKYEDAILCYSKGLEYAPSAVGFANRGHAHLSRGALQEALDDFTSALQLRKTYAEVLAWRADVYERQGTAEALGLAACDLTAAMTLEPQQTRGLVGVLESVLQQATSLLAKADLEVR